MNPTLCAPSQSDECVLDLKGHEREVCAVAWGSAAGSSGSLPLATASGDQTARLWEVEGGKCLHILKGHTEAVLAVTFNPSGRLLATGAADQQVHIWALDGTLVRTFHGTGQAYAVAWDSTGTQLAACFDSGLLCVLDIRM